jgi:hypothetical protein
MRTFTETLFMCLPMPASRILLGIDNPPHKRDLLRDMNRLRCTFEHGLKLRSQIIWHVRCCFSKSTLVTLNTCGVGDDTPRPCYGLPGTTPAVSKVVTLVVYYLIEILQDNLKHVIVDLDMQPFLASQSASVIASCSPSFLAEIREWQRVCFFFAFFGVYRYNNLPHPGFSYIKCAFDSHLWAVLILVFLLCNF